MIDYAEFIRTLSEACIPQERWRAVSRAVESELRAAKQEALASVPCWWTCTETREMDCTTAKRTIPCDRCTALAALDAGAADEKA